MEWVLLTIDSLTMITRVLSFSSDLGKEPSTWNWEGGSISEVYIAREFVKLKSEGWNPFLLDVRSESEESITSLEGTDLRITHTSVPGRYGEIPHGEGYRDLLQNRR